MKKQILITILISSLILLTGCSDNYFLVKNPIDELSGSLQIIAFEHHEIHEGNHFYINGFETKDNGENITFGVTTYNSNLTTHVTTTISGTSQLEIYIYENVTFSGGVQVEPFNNNRNSNHISNNSLFLSPTIIDNGYLISAQTSGKSGANPQKSSSGFASRLSEIILKQNTSYIFTTVSRDDGNIIDFRAEWYEHEGLN